MELLRRKRKGSGTETEPDHCIPMPLSHVGSHLSLEDHRQKKKCKEQKKVDLTGSCNSRVTGIVTAPPCGSSGSGSPGRGHKRKIGCIESATRIGRKKKLEQDYILRHEIGQGKFGCVRLCRSKANGAEFACKSLKKSGGESVHREVEIMQHLSGHPGVVTLQAVYEDSDSFHLVMELCPRGRLLDDMVKEGKYSEQRAAKLLKEVVWIIKYCHDMGVVHRDIKPENVLLATSGQLKLADFGLAVRVSDGQRLSGLAGSPAYVAPEVLVGNYTEKVDIWSAGVLLHALLVGFLPFQRDSVEAVFEAIKTVKLDFQNGVWNSISGTARDLISRMLTRDASKRISADEVLRHPWLMFYTESSLQTLTVKLRPKILGQPHQTRISGVDLGRSMLPAKRLPDGYVGYLSSGSSNPETDEEEDCGLVDALAAAISQVRISEPKRSRLCGPVIPIQQECSSNMKSNNLCTAF
ncbi:hypothetical protein H6P81_010728 [Aristolochia fimbriata]|uniref:Protein kinase domain-containing protein n=1 Tax=Aristolochia fimbriata TaxID=158543 RepID=A0AAV7EPT9_ARIFI|nr:hypothetical protein H6P81_010728 [Aristolochia fimbriata]